MPKTQEHSYKILNRVIKSGELPSVILLYGKERFMVDWAWRSLKKAVIEPAAESLDFTVFDDKDTSEEELIAACETFPLMSKRKMVLVKNFELGQSSYLNALPKSTLLVFALEKIDKRKSFYKSIEKIGLAYDFTPLDEAGLAGWARKRCDKISKPVLLQFASEAGYFDKDRSYGLYDLENDLLKAAALYRDNTDISLEELMFIASAEDENNAFKLLDAAFAEKKGEAMRLLNNSVKAEKASQQMGAVLRFHGLLCSQLEIMLEARQRKEAGKNLSEMGVNPYRLQKAVAASERLTSARLKAALSGCYRIESDIKSGKMPARLALELFIAKI